MYPGVLISRTAPRDIYAAIVFHNLHALFGVMNSINIESLLHSIYPVITMSIAAIAILGISDLLIVRKTKVNLDSFKAY